MVLVIGMAEENMKKEMSAVGGMPTSSEEQMDSGQQEIKEILKRAGYEEIEEGVFILDGGYELAKKYFEFDYDMMKSLEELDDEEKENLHFQSQINLNTKTALYRIGHWFRNTEHLVQFGNGIDNTSDVEDDFNGVIDFVRGLVREDDLIGD